MMICYRATETLTKGGLSIRAKTQNSGKFSGSSIYGRSKALVSPEVITIIVSSQFTNSGGNKFSITIKI